MPSVGPGVREIRILERSGAFRVIYVMAFAESIYVLHAFQKKTQKTTKKDLDVAKRSISVVAFGEVEMKYQEFDNAFDALMDTPEEAANMTMRSDLLIALQGVVEGWKISQAEAAKRLGITQPRLNDLLRGRINNFSLDALINLAPRAGLAVRLDLTPMKSSPKAA
jgi:predicted XRE-type DNA-binding protein